MGTTQLDDVAWVCMDAKTGEVTPRIIARAKEIMGT